MTNIAIYAAAIFAKRKKEVIEKLTNLGAINEDTSKSLEEMGFEKPKIYSSAVKRLVKENKIVETTNQKYYLSK